MQLKSVQDNICSLYSALGKKKQDQSRCHEFQESEQTNNYHHELYKRYVNKGQILKLDTEQGLIVGHKKCASYLEGQVREILGYPADLDIDSQNDLT